VDKESAGGDGFYAGVVGLTPLRIGDLRREKRRSQASGVCGVDHRPDAGGDGRRRQRGEIRSITSVLRCRNPNTNELDRRLQAAGVDTSVRMSHSYGAQGYAPEAFYFADPDGNVLEARYYE